jgi:hypothetical protein
MHEDDRLAVAGDLDRHALDESRRHGTPMQESGNFRKEPTRVGMQPP